MRKYAIITNDIVSQIVETDEPQLIVGNMVIDIQDVDPQPALGWVLNGNRLQFPQQTSNREQMELILAEKKTEFGIALAKNAVNLIGVRNKILNKNGTQVSAILNSLMPVKMLLETGALSTARYSCTLLRAVYTEYTDIFDKVINEINTFESTFGL